MQDRTRWLAAWVAIFAIALQAMFAGLAAVPAIAAPFDPATIICHSDPSGGGDTDHQVPAAQHDCCSNCILSSTLAAAATPESFALFVPPQSQAASFVPFSAVELTPLDGLAVHLARGPPRGV
jgi:hypothetical protein